MIAGPGDISTPSETSDLTALLMAEPTTSLTRPATARVISVARDEAHRFSKRPVERIRLIAGLGVEGDAHAGIKVQHRSRVAVNPDQPNLRQVHLIAAEAIAEWQAQGFAVTPGAMGENLTTSGLDLLALPRGTRLRIGSSAVIEITGLRNPCQQIEDFQPGLLSAVLEKDSEGRLLRKAGIMAIVLTGGEAAAGDVITVELPPEPHERLERV